MIALCREHHDAADAGAYTVEQVQEMKSRGCTDEVRGRFQWLRSQLVMEIGSNYLVNQLGVYRVNGVPILWFSRDPAGYLRLNLSWLRPDARVRIEEHDFVDLSGAVDVECPPSGKLLSVTYPDDDRLRIEFAEFTDADSFKKVLALDSWAREKLSHDVTYPATIMKFEIKNARLGIESTTDLMNFGGLVHLQQCVLFPNPKREFMIDLIIG